MTPDRPGQLPVRELLGICIHAMTEREVVAACDDAIRQRSPIRIGVVNAAKIVNMQKSPQLRESVATSDLVLADGASIVWASRILGQPLPERVAGIDLFEGLLALANRNGYRVFLLGAAKPVIQALCNLVEEKYPDLTLAGHADGYFSDEDSHRVAEEIRSSRADMLFVGISSPKKEIFMAKHEATLEVPVIHGVGGSFDVLAGVVKRAPKSWQNLGLEWLYRLLQEPRRMWKRYLVTNTLFLWMVALERLGVQRTR